MRSTAALREALELEEGALLDLSLYLSHPRTPAEIKKSILAAFALGFETGREFEQRTDRAAELSAIPQRSPQKQVYEFNRIFPVGTRVRYWTGERRGLGKVSLTRSEAQVLSGHTAVVWIEGVSGCVALTHAEPLPGSPKEDR